MRKQDSNRHRRRTTRLGYLVGVIGVLAACYGCNSVHSQGVRLFQGLGSIHHSISTKRRDAQDFFDQGLALAYGFNFSEAVRSFREAATIDPEAAMPYWGLALAQSPNYNAWSMSVDRQNAVRVAIGDARR